MAVAVGVEDPRISDELIRLLDAAFVQSFPRATRLIALLEERGWTGWTGWTDIRRTDLTV